MSHDLHSQLPQMLNGAPNLRARRAQLLGNAGAADDQRRILAQEANNVTKTRVGQALRRRSIYASWTSACDTRIMRVIMSG